MITYGSSSPCPECGSQPTPEGYDACLGKLPGVKFACCGHGREQGYIKFKNGRVIRGWFDHVIRTPAPEIARRPQPLSVEPFFPPIGSPRPAATNYALSIYRDANGQGEELYFDPTKPDWQALHLSFDPAISNAERSIALRLAPHGRRGFLLGSVRDCGRARRD
jgi:hypothetical protein